MQRVVDRLSVAAEHLAEVGVVYQIRTVRAPVRPVYPFDVHRLPIDNLAIGQTQLGNEVSGTDKTIWWSNPSIWEIGGG